MLPRRAAHGRRAPGGRSDLHDLDCCAASDWLRWLDTFMQPRILLVPSADV